MKLYFIFYKPYGVLSQFTKGDNHKALCDFGPFPKDIYPVGRLDADSEGLLLLTNDNSVKYRLSNPKFEHKKTYLVQVEGYPSPEEIDQLNRGIIIEGKRTKPAEVRILQKEPVIPPRPIPIRFRKNIQTVWLEISLREGRNRQIRKMTAAANHPTLRLIRKSILFLDIKGLNPGDHRQLTSDEIGKLLKSLSAP